LFEKEKDKNDTNLTKNLLNKNDNENFDWQTNEIQNGWIVNQNTQDYTNNNLDDNNIVKNLNWSNNNTQNVTNDDFNNKMDFDLRDFNKLQNSN
jgi:hypothetical protein